MTPKTKIQKRITELSKLLPDITAKHEEWSRIKLFDKYATRSRKTIFCLECGHSWKEESPLITTLSELKCPACNEILNLKSTYEPTFMNMSYFAILTTKESFQVVRIFASVKKYQKLNYPYHFVHEVMQHWIDSSGKAISMAKNIRGQSGYYDAWIGQSELTVKPNNFKEKQVYDISPNLIYPGSRILPEIKRNGFKGSYHGLAPHKFFTTILGDPKSETLLKSGQIALFKFRARNSGPYSSNKDKYWPLIKICIRNNYIVKDASLWFDHIDLLSKFDKDLHSPKYICSPTLNADHNRLIMKKRAIDRKEKIQEMREKLEADNVQYIEQKGKFLDITFSEGDITIRPLKSVEEFMYEGDELKHCVFTNEYYKNPDSLIMTARINDKPIETIEVLIHSMELTQSRGFRNKATEHHERIIDLVKANLPKIQERAVCNIL